MSRPGYSASATISAAWAKSRLVARFTTCANKLRSAASIAGESSTVGRSGDLGQEVGAVLFELLRPHAADAQQLIRGARAAQGHLLQGGVAEHDVGGHAPGVGQRPAQLAQAGEELGRLIVQRVAGGGVVAAAAWGAWFGRR